MASITVKNNQSLMDVSVEHCGAFDPVVDLAFANDISITDALETASEIDEVGAVDEKTAKLFGNLYNKPATALTRAEIRELCDEVGFNTADFGTFTYHFDNTFYKGEDSNGSVSYYAVWNQSVIRHNPFRESYSNIAFEGCYVDNSGSSSSDIIVKRNADEAKLTFDLQFAPTQGHKYLVLAKANLAVSIAEIFLDNKFSDGIVRYGSSAWFGNVLDADQGMGKTAGFRFRGLTGTSVFGMFVVDITLMFNGLYDSSSVEDVIKKVVSVADNIDGLEMLTDGQRREVNFPSYRG